MEFTLSWRTFSFPPFTLLGRGALSSSSPPHHTLPQLLPDSRDLYRCYLLRGLSEAGAGGSINILRRWEREGGIRCRQTKDDIFTLYSYNLSFKTSVMGKRVQSWNIEEKILHSNGKKYSIWRLKQHMSEKDLLDDLEEKLRKLCSVCMCIVCVCVYVYSSQFMSKFFNLIYREYLMKFLDILGKIFTHYKRWYE